MTVKVKCVTAFLSLAAGCTVMVSANAAPGEQGNAPGFVVYSKPVCPGPVSLGNSRCNSWVVTNSKGVPKATGVVTYNPFAKGGKGGGGPGGGKGGGGGGSGGGSTTTPPPPSGSYGPAQWQAAYGLGGSSTETVAIVDAYDDPNIAQDLASYITAYQSEFSTPPCVGGNCFTKVNQTGGTRYPKSNQGWALEISLDVETLRAACPACKILLVEASSSRLSDLIQAEQYAENHANVVSNSWGGSEFSSEVSDDSYFDQSMPITFSSGDSGYGVEWPAASPNVTAVGGTTLQSNLSQIAWSGSGSGCSAYESQPPWQNSLVGNSGCTMRMVADVSADADPATGAAVYDTYGYQGQSGWFIVGGTSLASPLIASAYAFGGSNETNDSDTNENLLADVYNDSALLKDVIKGSNGACGNLLCTAGPGYDGPTGLGTPGVGAF